MDSVYVTVGVTVGIQVLGATAVVASVRQMVADNRRRVERLEDRNDNAPVQFIPRSELQVILAAIQGKVDDIKELLHALLKRPPASSPINALQAAGAPMQYSSDGFSLTEGMEALRLTAYRDDGKGVLTIGWGHTGPDVSEGMVITVAQAVELLRQDTAAAVSFVNRHVLVPLTQHQFDALVDFVFNEGGTHFLGSSLLRELNAGHYTAAASHFGDWVLAGGKRLGGLVRRRAAEDALFLEAA